MIRRPQIDDMREHRSVAIAREVGELVVEVVERPTKGFSKAALFLIFVFGFCPIGMVALLLVLGGRWPVFFGSALGHHFLVGIFGAVAYWLFWRGDLARRREVRRERLAYLEDTAAMRTALLAPEQVEESEL